MASNVDHDDSNLDYDDLLYSSECELTLQILKKLTKDFVSPATAKSLVKANSDLHEANKRFLYNKLIAENIHDFKQEKFLSEPSDAPVSKDSVLYSPLYLNHIKQLVSPDSKDELPLFGINEEIIKGIVSTRKESNQQKAELCEFIKHKIDDLSSKIIEYTTQVTDICWSKKFEVVMKSLSRELDQIHVKEGYAISDRDAIEYMISVYLKSLSESVSMLSALVKLYLKKLENECVMADVLLNQGSTLSLKVKRLEHDALDDAYRRENIQALKKINEQIEMKREKLEKQFFNSRITLQLYEPLGPEYETLVQKYTELYEKVKNEKWALNCVQNDYGIKLDDIDSSGCAKSPVNSEADDSYYSREFNPHEESSESNSAVNLTVESSLSLADNSNDSKSDDFNQL